MKLMGEVTNKIAIVDDMIDTEQQTQAQTLQDEAQKFI